MRAEGDWWVAYLARPNTMEGAIEIARIQLGVVYKPDRRDAFLTMMSDVIADAIEANYGERPDMIEQPASESASKAGDSGSA